MTELTLRNGMKIPQIGLGTWQITDRELMRSVIADSFELGYRLIDTAAAYSNEIAVAKAIQQCLRPTDMPVRYGGEEFTIFLPGTSIESAKIVGERLRATVEAMKIPLPDQNDCISVTISVGFTERQAGDSVEAIIKRADDALYNAKENGRNRVCVNLGDGTMFLF